MAKNGQTAVVHYRGTDAAGVVFDSTDGIEPLEFVIGSGAVINGFDVAVLGMEVGETTTVTIPYAEAFGEYRQEAVEAVMVATVPNAQHLMPGKTILFNAPDGQRVPARILKIESGMAYFDFNHWLAGKDLVFEITVVDLLDC